MSSRFKMRVSPNGEITAIHNDHLVGLYKDVRGTATIKRASHVEPRPDGQWEADMKPSGGPILGPFLTRQEALDAEVDWLKDKLFNQ